MYSQKLVDAILDDHAARKGWRPILHSVAEVAEFNAYVESITTVEANSKNRYFSWKPGKRPNDQRVKWIRRWVENEQFACFASAEYFVTRYGKIRNVEEQIIRFDFRIAQRIFHNAVAEADELQTAIQLFILKARQLGCSTVVALYFLHRILFRSNTYAIMASVQKQQSDKLSNMIETTWSRLPFWLPPPKTVLKALEPKWANGSLLSIQWGTQEVGIAQGTTPTNIHISEVGDYANPKRTLDEGLFPACHQTKSLFLVLEGTGSMATTWQKETWDYSVENYGKGGRFRPFFIPPACAGDIYPPADWLRANSIPASWNPSEDCRRMRRRAELFVRSTDYLWKVLGQRWEMDREFMWYWECGYKEAVSKHAEREFLSQMAPTPEDAFQSKNASVFTKETIDVVSAGRTKVYKAYAITGRTILIGNENEPYCPPPEEIDFTEQRIPLHWEASDGNVYDWELVPLKPFDDSRDENCFDKLLIFEPPENNRQYAVSVDTAYGLNTPNEDRAALSVQLDNQGQEPDIQVASFTSLRVNSPQMARLAAALGVLYGTDGHGNVTASDPLLVKYVIEQVRKPGDECQHQLKIMGFLHHHIMLYYDSKGNIDPNKGSKEGWRTTRWSRSILLERFVDAVNTGWLILNDPIAIRQLESFERKYKDRGLSEMEHATGAHDDNIFACAMGWTTLHDLENTALRLEKKYRPPAKQIIPVDNWCSRAVFLD